jgi:hypothetical protein
MYCIELFNQNNKAMDKNSYYLNEVNKINFHCLYCPTIKIRDENSETKWIDVNKESAKIIIDKLKKEFNIK